MRLPIVNNYTIFTDLLTIIGKLNPANKVNAAHANGRVADPNKFAEQLKYEGDRERIEEDRSTGGKIDVYA